MARRDGVRQEIREQIRVALAYLPVKLTKTELLRALQRNVMSSSPLWQVDAGTGEWHRRLKLMREEINRAMKRVMPSRTSCKVRYAFWHLRRPWWIVVCCDWCKDLPRVHSRRGCMVCASLYRRLDAFLISAEWQRWRALLREDPETRFIVADWLEDQDEFELAKLFRTAAPPQVEVACADRGTGDGSVKEVTP